MTVKLISLAARPTDVLGDRAVALRALSSLLRAGLAPREALEVWHEDAPDSLGAVLGRLARRLLLSEPTTDALAGLDEGFGHDARSLRIVFAVARILGGDLARMIDDLATTIERRRDAQQTTLAAVAGMTLSARIVAGLPLVCLPLLPASGAPLWDGPGVLVVVVGVVLTMTGMRWMSRLTPTPSEAEDPVSALARAVARSLAGGAGLKASLDVASQHAPEDVTVKLHHARRLSHLGLAWPAALKRTGDRDLAGLSVALERAARKGLPAAQALDALARRRDHEAMRRLDRSVRRAPILMAVPLVVCVLPAFLLLGVVPFLRGLAS